MLASRARNTAVIQSIHRIELSLYHAMNRALAGMSLWQKNESCSSIYGAAPDDKALYDYDDL